MKNSPLFIEPLFHLGPVPVSAPVLVTWGLMAAALLFCALATRRPDLVPSKLQTVLELMVTAVDHQIQDTMQLDPAPYRPLIGGFFLFVLLANWSSLLPGIEPPTAHVETDAALALIVLAATIYHGMRVRGFTGYLKSFAEPSWAMIPLNLIEQITRSFSLVVRLFGNVMSGVFVVGIVLSLAGLFVPIPLMLLDLLTGAVQAYIFATLATVFIAAAVTGDSDRPKQGADHDH